MTRHVFRVLWPLALVWIVLLSFAFITDAKMPAEGRRLDFAIVLAIASFDLLMATMLFRRMGALDWLAIALGLVFVVKSSLWFYAAGAQLWPAFAADHRETILWALRIGLIGTLVSAFVMLLITPDESTPDEARAEGVIEGYEEGMIEGHAEGMAQEASDQLSRENAKAD
jgi:hypothetical protein